MKMSLTEVIAGLTKTMHGLFTPEGHFDLAFAHGLFSVSTQLI
jgi:hypothetical protein